MIKPGFIETSNTKKLNDICAELTSPTSLIGPSLAMVTGPAGRGKSEAARHYAVNSDAIYIPPMNVRTPAMVLREISFELSGMRPSRSDACLNILDEEMRKYRRLIIIDEADLLEMKVLEMLRNVNERFACPVLLIGEEELKGKVGSRRRIASRIRRRLEFDAVNQFDIAIFFKISMNVKLNSELTAIIHRHAHGDWRPVLTTAISIDRAMQASGGTTEITEEMINNVLKNM